MRIIGLTGGIGSGKTEVGRRLETHGFPVINADHVGHELLSPEHPIAHCVIDAFGQDILENGKIDRKKLGALVFGDKQALERLNGIMHPELKQEIRRRCDLYDQQGHSIIIVDAAILGENGMLDPWLDGLILVLADMETRVHRLTEVRGMTENEARARIAAQVPPEQKRPLATHVLENNGSLKDLYTDVDMLAKELTAHVLG